MEKEKDTDVLAEFQDIPLFNQYDGKFPVLSPEYKNTTCESDVIQISRPSKSSRLW